MGPIIGVPSEVAQRIKDTTDLVEVDELLPDVVDQPDVQVGEAPFDDILLLTEAPAQGYGRLVGILTDYARKGPRPLQLVVLDQLNRPHLFPAHSDPSETSISEHLELAFYGEPGDRRRLVRDDHGSR